MLDERLLLSKARSAGWLLLVLLWVPLDSRAACNNQFDAVSWSRRCEDGIVWYCESHTCLYCPECDTNCSCDTMAYCWCEDHYIPKTDCWTWGCPSGGASAPKVQSQALASAGGSRSPLCLPAGLLISTPAKATVRKVKGRGK